MITNPNALNKVIRDLDDFIKQFCKDNPARARTLRGVLKLAKELRPTLKVAPFLSPLLSAIMVDPLNAGELEMMNNRGALGAQSCLGNDCDR